MKFRLYLMATLALLKVSNTLAAQPDAGNATNAPAATHTRTFQIRGYRIEGNTVLPPGRFRFLAGYTGPAVDFQRLRQGLSELQLLYRDLGFATVSVTLPQQRLTNGMVLVKIIEGKLSNIKVEGNRYFSSNNVMRALSSLDTNILLNTRWFQPELDQANASSDRQIYPVISPGLEPGTTDLTLKVKDRLPLHGHIELNDKSTPGTPVLRLDSTLLYDNLWQLNHQVGLEYNFSPQALKSDTFSPNYYDQPQVANYSGFYRIPFAFGSGLREDYDQHPVDFGYDEISHKFNLPAVTGNPEWIVYASRSTSESPTRFGPVTLITNTVLANISSQFAQRNLTDTENLGTKLTIPIPEFAGVHSSLALGFDFKSYEASSFNTNLTYFDLYALDPLGNPVLETNRTIALGANSRNALQYMPFSIGWSGSRPDKWGSTGLNYNQSFFFTPLASPRTNFQTVAFSSAAGGNYTTLNAGLTREQLLPDDWSLLLRTSGQWSSAPLINNEQFELGGTSGVRGYQEGEAYGDTGWKALFDVRAPAVNVGEFPTGNGDVPAYLRCSWFMDYGTVYLLDRPGLTRDHLSEWGTGIDLLVTAGEHFNARLAVAWSLASGASSSNPNDTLVLSRPGSAQAYFSIGFQF